MVPFKLLSGNQEQQNRYDFNLPFYVGAPSGII